MKGSLVLVPLTLYVSVAHGQDCSKAASLPKHIYKPDGVVEQKAGLQLKTHPREAQRSRW